MASDREDFFDEEEEEEGGSGRKDTQRAAFFQKILKYLIGAAVIIVVLITQWIITEIVFHVKFGDILEEKKAKFQASQPKFPFSLGDMQFSLMTQNAFIHFNNIILALDKEQEAKKDEIGFQKDKIKHILQKVISSKTYDDLKSDEKRRTKLKPELLTKLNEALGYEKKHIIVDIYMPGVRVFKAP